MSNKYQYKVQGVDYEVEIESVEGNIANVSVNGIPFEVELQQPINAAKHPGIVKKTAAPSVSATNPESAAPATATPKAAAPAPGGQGSAASALRAPLPGTINAVNVKVGDAVAAGDVVIILEAMKMQNNIEAEQAGTVKTVDVSVGDSVMEGTVLLTIG